MNETTSMVLSLVSAAAAAATIVLAELRVRMWRRRYEELDKVVKQAHRIVRAAMAAHGVNVEVRRRSSEHPIVQRQVTDADLGILRGPMHRPTDGGVSN